MFCKISYIFSYFNICSHKTLWRFMFTRHFFLTLSVLWQDKTISFFFFFTDNIAYWKHSSAVFWQSTLSRKSYMGISPDLLANTQSCCGWRNKYMCNNECKVSYEKQIYFLSKKKIRFTSMYTVMKGHIVWLIQHIFFFF